MNPLDTIKSMNIADIQKLFKRPIFDVEQEKAIKQYHVRKHDVFDPAIRQKREISIDTGRVDDEGKPIKQKVWVDVVRVGIPWQTIITGRRVGFTLSEPVKVEAIFDKETDKEKQLVKYVERIQNENKMDYKNKEILRRKLSEMEVAVIWYFVETGELKPKFTLRCKVLSTELGDDLYPLFDSTGDLIAFARGYKLNDGAKDIEHFDVYTAEFEYKYVNLNGWALDTSVTGISESGETITKNPIPNSFKKIPIEYYCQTKPVWDDVQPMIERHETLSSNHGGMNDKFGAPLLTITGAIMDATSDNTTGSMLQLENGGKAEYAALASEPQSIKLEQENLEKNIYTMSQTPDISFASMKGIGNVAEFTMDAFFIDAHMAVYTEEETFGIGLQRRLNLIKAAIANVIDTSLANEAKMVQLKPVITPYRPHNTTELVDNLSIAVTAGLMSKETAIENNPLVSDPTVEMDRMKNDATAQIAGQ